MKRQICLALIAWMAGCTDSGTGVIGEWHDTTATANYSGVINLERDARHDMVVEYFKGQGPASVTLRWEGPQLSPSVSHCHAAPVSHSQGNAGAGSGR